MNTHILRSYRQPLYRIILECLEVTFTICKKELQEYTIAKIFDVFSQILPTAFVLQTGYWPFYNTNKKHSICVCGRFCIHCRHTIQNYHWLDLESLSNDQSMIFSAHIGEFTILEYNVNITPHDAAPAGYTININLLIKYHNINQNPESKKRRDQIIRSAKLNPEVPFKVSINCRYNVQVEFYKSFGPMVFHPNPFFHETYGSIFHDLIIARQPFVAHIQDRTNSYYMVNTENMPRFSLVLQGVNLPTFRRCGHQQVCLVGANPVGNTFNNQIPNQQISYGLNPIQQQIRANQIRLARLALGSNDNSTQTEEQPRINRRNQAEPPANNEANEAAAGCSNQQPSTFSTDNSLVKFGWNESNLHNMRKSVLIPGIQQMRKQLEMEFLLEQQMEDDYNFN